MDTKDKMKLIAFYRIVHTVHIIPKKSMELSPK
jgi:hypothetical protein